jgi:hypothetical protein
VTDLDKLTAAGQSAADAADALAVSGAKSETILRAIQSAAGLGVINDLSTIGTTTHD